MLNSTLLPFFGLSALAVVGVWGLFIRDGGFDDMDALVASYPSTGIVGIRRFPELDRGLMSIVAFNLCAVNSAAYPFMLQFLANVAVVPVILCTEDSLASPGSLDRNSTMWGLLSQLCTSAVIYPLYAVSFLRRSSSSPPPTRQHASDAKIILSLVIGFMVPAAFMLNVFNTSVEIQIWGILAFTVYPISMALATQIIDLKHLGAVSSRPKTQRQTIPVWRYILVGGMAMQGHLWYLAEMSGLLTRSTSLAGVGLASISDRGSRLVLRFLQIDYVLTFMAMLILTWHELTRRGDMSAWTTAVWLTLGWVFLGPGATLAAAWYMRGRLPPASAAGKGTVSRTQK